MEKKLYNSPLTEVASVKMSTVVLAESPVVPPTPGGPAGAPLRKTPVLGNDSVPVF